LVVVSMSSRFPVTTPELSRVQRIRQCQHLAALGAAGAESNLIQCRQSELRNILMDLQRLVQFSTAVQISQMLP
jgi:hypothetical protein